MLPPLDRPFIPDSLSCPFNAVRLSARTHVTAKLQHPHIMHVRTLNRIWINKVAQW
jgi:hypothetical protein